MNKKGLAMLAGFLILSGNAFAGETPYKAPPSQPSYVFCTALDPSHELPDESISPQKIYYSGAFKADLTQNLNPTRAAFYKFLQEKYKYVENPSYGDQSISCTGTRSMEEAQTVAQARIKKANGAAPNTTIETGWTPS